MIRIVRPELPEHVAGKLAAKTAQIACVTDHQRATTARTMWRGAKPHTDIREVLAAMAPGREYCMYCGDNHGTDIDHFEPIARNPLRTFDWLNHLLACTTCNSHHKRDQFPVDDAGHALLIDPTAEDPSEHLLLTLAEGEYVALSEKGQFTMEICRLNAPRLKQGRANARHQFAACLEKWSQAHQSGDFDAMAEWAATVRLQPYADVCQAMLRQVEMPGAAEVLDATELRLLRLPELREALLT